jgi:hypothetical protein
MKSNGSAKVPFGTKVQVELQEFVIIVACTRFRRHRVRCFDGTGGESWRGEDLRESSSLRRCG